MVHVLIALRTTIIRGGTGRIPRGWLLALAAFGLVCAAGTLTLGIIGYAHPGAGADVVALVVGVWMVGRIAQAALTGDTTLHPELFRMLPIPRRRLAGALLLVNLADPSLVVLAVAFGAVIALGAHSGPVGVLVGVLAAGLSLLLTSVLSTLAGGLLAPGSRRGHDTGTVLLAIVISVVAVAGSLSPTLSPTLMATLTGRTSPALTVAVRLLPSGWGPVAIDAVSRSDWVMVTVPLLCLVALTAAAALAWPTVLSRRMDGASAPTRTGAGRTHRFTLLPRTPAGAVAGKELRLWARDPVRLTCLLIAAIVGAAVCAIPHLTAGTNAMLPLAGALTVVIAGACACNLYGTDGTSLWPVVMTPRSARPDVRGRQAAWLLIVAPYTAAISIALTAISGQGWAWPWVLAGLPALLGGGTGLAAYGSLISVQPRDDTGNPTPAWSLKVHIALPLVALTATPPAILLAAGTMAHNAWLLWAAVPVGIATAVVYTQQLGRLATRRLQRNQVTILRRLVGVP